MPLISIPKCDIARLCKRCVDKNPEINPECESQEFADVCELCKEILKKTANEELLELKKRVIRLELELSDIRRVEKEKKRREAKKALRNASKR